MNSKHLERLIDFAIAEEKRSAELYAGLAEKIKDKGARTMLQDMAAMENGHARKLADFKSGHEMGINAGKVANLKLAEYMVEKPLSEDSGIQEVILFAIQAELKAWQTYSSMSQFYEEPHKRDFLAALAAEELKHKNALEKAYDDNIFKEN